MGMDWTKLAAMLHSPSASISWLASTGLPFAARIYETLTAEERDYICSPKAFAIATLSSIPMRGMTMMADPSWATMPPKSVVTVVPLLVEKGGGVRAGRPAWICPVRVNTHRSGSSEQGVAAGSSSMASTRHTITMMAFLGNKTVSHVPHIYI